MRGFMPTRTIARSFVLATVLTLAATTVVATPASATTATVSDLAGLSSAVSSGGTVTIGAPITAPTSTITVSGIVTVDLSGRNVSVRRVVVSSGSTLIITNSSATRATFTVDSSTYPNDAAFSTTLATLEIGGNADVVALAGPGGAGIGGDTGNGGGVTKVYGHATLRAVGAMKGAGIGGGQDGSGTMSTLAISDSAVVTVEANVLAASAIGDFKSAGTVTVGPGAKLIIPVGSKVVTTTEPGSTINNQGTIMVNGTLTGPGTITNSGSIGGTGTVSAGGVSGTQFGITFNAAAGAVAGPSTITIYADTFSDAGQTIPSATRSGYAFDGWLLNNIPLKSTTSLSWALGSGVSSGTAVAVWKATVTVTLAQTAAPTYGSPFTATATVTAATAEARAGSVEFFATSIATPVTAVSLGTASTVNGVAALTTSWTRPAGEYSITATFSGAEGAGASNVRVVTATKGTPTGAFTATSGTVSLGLATTATVQLSPASATGTIRLVIDGSDYATVTAVDGAATFVIPPTLAVGDHTLAAFYSGDSNWFATFAQRSLTVAAVATSTATNSGTGTGTNSGTSAGATTTPTSAPVSATSTALWLTAPTAVYGGTSTLTAHIGGSATGTVTFSAGGATLGVAAVSGGFATMAVPTLSAGTHAIVATYSGDAGHAPSVSSVALLTVTKATTKVTVSAKKFSTGSKPKVTVKLAKLDNGSVVTGKVAIFVGKKKVKTVSVTAAKTKVTLKKKYSKTITVTARYLGSANVLKVSSKAKKVVAK